LSNEILLGRRWARDGQVIWRNEVHIQRVIEEAVVKTARQDVLLRVAVTAKELGVELEVILRKPLTEVVEAGICEMAEI
jgi:uncharacterized protein (DUF2126 family)